MRRSAPFALLVPADLAIGWLNYHATDDVQPVAAALLVAAFGFTLWRPRWAWFFTLAIWLAIPISSIVGYATNHFSGADGPAYLYQTVVALIPAGLGTALALGARWVAGQSRT